MTDPVWFGEEQLKDPKDPRSPKDLLGNPTGEAVNLDEWIKLQLEREA